MKYITIAGTFGASHDDDWDSYESPFSMFLATQGHTPLVASPLKRYMWSTSLDGVMGRNATWDAAGRALASYIIPPLYGEALLPQADTFLIAHSHGGNVVAYACGKYGLKINGLVTIGTPIRNDLHDMYEAAAPNITRHLHLHGGWKDYWQVLGELPAIFGIHRDAPFAHNENTPGGHGAVIKEKKYFPLWLSHDWLKYWAGPV